MIAMIVLVLTMAVAVVSWETCMYCSSKKEETQPADLAVDAAVDAAPAE